MGSFDILDTSPKATLDSQAEWSGGLIGSSTSRGILCAARLGGVQPGSAFNWRRPFGDTFRSTLFSGVELVSFNFGLPGWVGFLEVFGKKKDWDL